MFYMMDEMSNGNKKLSSSIVWYWSGVIFWGIFIAFWWYFIGHDENNEFVPKTSGPNQSKWLVMRKMVGRALSWVFAENTNFQTKILTLFIVDWTDQKPRNSERKSCFRFQFQSSDSPYKFNLSKVIQLVSSIESRKITK